MKKRWESVNGPGLARLRREDGILLAWDTDGCWLEVDSTGHRPTADGPEVYDLVEALLDIERVYGE